MKSSLRISPTKGQDFESYTAGFLPCWALSLAFRMLVRNHSPVRMMRNFQDVLMGYWDVLNLPLPAGILLCPLMVFMSEKDILKSEDSFGNAVAVKNA